MDIIRLLPDVVANQIAAGEVIQRPASVVKELVENSVDAGATLISVHIFEGGKTAIQVVDNGKGMSPSDAVLSFERHSTSKISQADDLFSLTTMGFRGEALASIAAVAQVELHTRRADDELGSQILIEAGRVRSNQRIACPVGANFCVRNLFFNVPARRRFLKSTSTELNAILTEFQRIAVAHPDVALKLYRDNTIMLDLPAANFHQRIVGVFGKRLDGHLVPIDVTTSLGHISGFVGTPDSARHKGAQQYFVVNHRFMRHPYFARAVLAAYERLIPEGAQVPFFIEFEVDPATIDVNIHPTKTEIKFQDEPTLWQILLAAVREGLGRYNATPAIDFDTAGSPDLPPFGSTIPSQPPSMGINPSYNPFRTASSPSKEVTTGRTSMKSDYPEETPSYSFASPEAAADGDEPTLPFDVKEVAGEVVVSPDTAYLQFEGRYVVCTVSGGLMFVDQHRAHIRILYERYCRHIEQGNAPSQGMLFPQDVELEPVLHTVYEHIAGDLTAVGFDVREAGEGRLTICGVPAGTEGISPEKLLLDVLTEAATEPANATDSVRRHIALTLARKSAIPVGQYLSEEEMKTLMQQLFSSSTPAYTPDGQAVVVVVRSENIGRLF